MTKGVIRVVLGGWVVVLVVLCFSFAVLVLVTGSVHILYTIVVKCCGEIEWCFWLGVGFGGGQCHFRMRRRSQQGQPMQQIMTRHPLRRLDQHKHLPQHYKHNPYGSQDRMCIGSRGRGIVAYKYPFLRHDKFGPMLDISPHKLVLVDRYINHHYRPCRMGIGY